MISTTIKFLCDMALGMKWVDGSHPYHVYAIAEELSCALAYDELCTADIYILWP